MKVRLGWLLGSVTARVTGPGQGEFINRCAALGADLWTMERLEGDELLVRAPGRAAPLLRQAAAESGCSLSQARLRGLPFFLRGFRQRYALAAGLPDDPTPLAEGGCGAKAYGQAVAGSDLVDPLADLDITVQSFDIPRTVSVYPDQAGIRWWTKAWFNNRKDGEASVEISRQNAILFIRNQVEKDEWLEEHFPRQMEVYHNAIEETRKQLLAQQVNM